MNKILIGEDPDVLDKAISAIVQYVKDELLKNGKTSFHSRYECHNGMSVTIDISLEN